MLRTPFRIVVPMLAVAVCGVPLACGGRFLGSDDRESTATDAATDSDGNRDPLVGSWTFSGSVPDIITVTLTFSPDKAFTIVETVTPPTLPAGFKPTSCVTTDTYLGMYAEGVAGGTNTLDLTFTGGTANAVVGCDAGSAGTLMTSDSIAAYRDQGLVPATMNTYAVTSTTLVLTPTPSNPSIVGLATNPTTFTKPD